jgi:hypothetical protein
MMHCLQPSECDGGASILVDGFSAATKLRDQNREQFDLLTRIPIPHRHIRQCHVDRDEFFSRMRALRRRRDEAA